MRSKLQKRIIERLTCKRNWKNLFNSQNRSQRKDATSIPATFLRVTVAL
jgi:hypothetical protein